MGSEFRLNAPPKGKPTSLSLTPMAVNPIYDGPTYERPGGEAFKALLGASIPNTPNTPMGESPRYFDMPPSLPPPRKASVSARSHYPSPRIPEEDELPTCVGADQMTSAQSVVSRPPHVPPALYEAMGGECTSMK